MAPTVSNKRTKRKRSEVGSSGNNELELQRVPKSYLQKARLLIGDSINDIEKNVANVLQGFDDRILNLEAKLKKVNDEQKRNLKNVNRELKKVKAENKNVNRELKKVKAENKTSKSRIARLETENKALRSRIVTLETENKALRSRIVTLEKPTPSPLNSTMIEDSYGNAEGSLQPSEGNDSMEIAALPDEEDARFKCNYCNKNEKDLLCFNCTNESIEGAKNTFIESMEQLPATQVNQNRIFMRESALI